MDCFKIYQFSAIEVSGMYSRDGDFGQVRLAEPLHTQQALDTLFCFSGAGWHRCNDRYAIRRPQGNTDPLLLFTAKGEGQLRIDTGSWRLKPGSVAFIPADAPHEYGTPAGGIWEFTWIHLCGRLALQFVQQLGTGILPVHHAAVYGEMVEQLLTLYRQPARTAEIQASQLLAELLHKLVLEAAQTVQSDTCRQAIQYLEQHYTRRITLDELSSRLYLSPAHLIRRFKAETGYTPHEYLNRLRLLKARQRLWYSDEPVEAVARAVGFAHTSYFIRQYKAQYGVTPGTERRL